MNTKQKNSWVMALVPCAALVLSGCEGDKTFAEEKAQLPESSDGGAMDTDTDADSDTDVDSDSDLDTASSCGDNVYSGEGQLEWVKSIGGTSMDHPYEVTMLPNGVVIVTGYSVATGAVFGEGETSETTLPMGGFVAAYTNEGALSWASPVCDGTCFASGVSPFLDNSFIAVGGFQGTAVFGADDPGDISLTTYSLGEGFVSRFDADGRLIWARGIVSDGRVDQLAVATADGGFEVVTGIFSGKAVFGVGGAEQVTREAVDEYDHFIARFDSDGEVDWIVQASHWEVATYSDIALIEDGTSFITGVQCVPMTFSPGKPDEASLEGDGICAVFLARISANGTVEWAKRLNGVSGDFGLGIASSADGSGVYVTSCFYWTQVFGPGEPNETVLECEAACECALVAKYDETGALDWVQQVAGGRWGNGMDVAAFDDGSVAVTGAFSGSSVFGPGQFAETTLTPDGDNDVFVARYGADGELIWASRAGGCNPISGSMSDDFEWGESVTALPDGSSIVTGVFVDSAVFAEGEDNETTLVSHGSTDIFLSKFEP
jgi:hypothetical protein